VLVGTALAVHDTEDLLVLAFLATLLGALLIQVGTNLSNDYSDARRGADTEDRLGPVRVTAGGLVPPQRVLVATYVTFALVVLVGMYLVYVAGPELLLVGAASILAGVLYTGGPRPYGYEGLGEVFVFTFFGIVAVTGTYYVQVERLPWEAFVLAVPVGLPARRSWWSTTSRPSRPTAGRASGRSRADGAARDAGVYAGCSRSRSCACAPRAGRSAPGSCSPCSPPPLAVKLVGTVRTHADGPTLTACSPGRASWQLVSASCCRLGILLS
jgi:1,4-dihydroxy-2-naphthoate octaprenyltransferase